MAVVGLKNLCTPALIYMSVSLLILFVMLFYHFNNVNILCLGNSSCIMVFVIKITYILFWTWILNIICKNGDETISWILLLMPVIVLVFLVVYYYIVG